MRKSSNISTYKLGINKKRCRTKLFLSKDNEGAHSLYHYRHSKFQNIKCITLRDIFGLCKIKKVDIMKLDIEGAEYGIIFSATNSIFSKINSIILEFHNYFGFRRSYKDIEQFLRNKGYTTKILTPQIIVNLFGVGILMAIKN